MMPMIGLALFAAFFIVIWIGRSAMLKEAEQRVEEWAHDRGFRIKKCELAGGPWNCRRLTWRIQVATPSGELREGWARGGHSIKDPVEVEWSELGQSPFN